MRIISGSHKGRRITAPKNLPVRPTTDLAKESLFNILANYVDFDEMSILDLFAGTGNLTYEFSSRGCKDVIAVDMNSNCTQFIRNTARKLDFQNIHVIRMNGFSFIETTKKKFDLIFVDPPYGMQETETIPRLIFERSLLNKPGWLIMEHSGSTNFNNNKNLWQTRKYGSVHFSIFKI